MDISPELRSVSHVPQTGRNVPETDVGVLRLHHKTESISLLDLLCQISTKEKEVESVKNNYMTHPYETPFSGYTSFTEPF